MLTGHCLDIGTGVPFGRCARRCAAPVVDRRRDTCRQSPRGFLPFLRAGPPTGEARLLEDLGLVVGELSDERPVLLVLEDMHWADRSTQDFAVAVAGQRRGRFPDLTYRTDELTGAIPSGRR